MIKDEKKQKRKRWGSRGAKRFFPLILLLLILAAIGLFWGNISWIANGNVWRQILADAFPQYFPRPYVLVTKNPALISGTPQIDDRASIKSAGSGVAANAAGKKPRRDILTIPKINITAPIITAETYDEEVINGLLDFGVVLYPGSVPFGESGQTVILGHSAPAGWPKIKYEWVFSKINELEKGDMVVATYDSITRYYKVAGSQIVNPKDGVPAPTVEGNSLMIISCWPPGKSVKRIAVEAEL